MIRPVTAVCMLLAGASGIYLYQVKHQSQLLDREIARVVHEAQSTRERAGVLRAEYTLLNDPSRLSELAAANLPELKTTAPSQFTAVAELDKHLPPVGAPPVEASPLEPEAPAAKLPDPVPPPEFRDARPDPKPEPVRAAPAVAAAPRPAPHPAAVQQAVLPPPAPTPRPSVTPVSLTAILAPPPPARPASVLARPAPRPAPVASPPPAYAPPAVQHAYAPPPAPEPARLVRNDPPPPAPFVGSALGMARAMAPPPRPGVWQQSGYQPPGAQ